MTPWTGIRLDKVTGETAEHQHKLAQLFMIEHGVVRVSSPKGSWIIPAGRVGYIAPGIKHSAKKYGSLRGWSVYLPSRRALPDTSDVSILKTSKLLLVTLERLAEPRKVDISRGFERNLKGLILAELSRAEVEPLGLMLPRSPKLIKVAESILRDGPQGKKVGFWATETGMSVRSFSRHFSQETGMTFESWRTGATHQKAIELLSRGENVTATALTLGYDSVSAFIASFRRYYGASPTKFMRTAIAQT